MCDQRLVSDGLIIPPAESVPGLNNREIAPISSPYGVGVENQTILASPLGSELVGVIWLMPCSAYVEIFVRRVCRTVPHPTWLRTHSPIPTCTPTGSRHGPWNSCMFWWEHQSSASLDSAIGTGFYKLLSVFDILYTPYMPKFICQHSAIIETTVKQRPLAFVSFEFQQGRAPASSTSALF